MTTPQWAPAEVLELDPNSSHFTCIGYAKSKNRRCHNPIACANRQEGAKILLEMSRLDPQSQRLDNRLEELASRLLCKRWHQDQAARIKRQWHREIENYRVAETTRLAEESGGRNDDEPNEEESEQQRDPDPDSSSQQEAALQETNHQENNSSPTSSSSDEITAHAPDAPLREQIVAIREEAADARGSEERVPEMPTQEQPHGQSLHSHDRRTIEGDCSICCEDLRSGGAIVWCRAQCRQNFHSSCIDLWHASLEADGRRKTCPYW